MSHPFDGSSLDLEQDLVRYMVERRVSRRQLLEAVARFGPAVALAPIIAACTSSGGASSAAPSASAVESAAAPASASAEASAAVAAPTPVPVPEDALNIYNWTDYIGEGVIPAFNKKYPNVKVTYDFFANIDEAYTKLGDDGGGYDISFPISVDVPKLIKKGALLALDKSLLPNVVNLGKEWSNPLYDPGNANTVPYLWWTTGVGYDPAKIPETLTSSKALWDPRWSKHIEMLDDWQEAFGLALIQLGHDANSTNTAELDAALALLEQQKPLVRIYSTDTITQMSGGDNWIGQIWGADRFKIQEEIADFTYYIPEEGSVKGSDTLAIFSGTKHPIAAHLFINHMLDAQISADNTNAIYYMGPNAAAKEFIDPAILADPTVNPDQAIVDKLYELIDQGQVARDEYLSRWHTLHGG